MGKIGNWVNGVLDNMGVGFQKAGDSDLVGEFVAGVNEAPAGVNENRYEYNDIGKVDAYKNSLDWSKNAAEESVKVSGGTPGSEMQALINESKKNAVKDWQKEEVLKWENTDKSSIVRDENREKLNVNLSMRSAGTSMGSGKLPIGNNVKKSGSQIGKHMNKYGV